jgi:class I fructose-bisphosphate aldolase
MGSDEDIFKMVEGALQAGAAGLSIGRNAFQHKDPTRVIGALSKMVHEGCSVEQAKEFLSK